MSSIGTGYDLSVTSYSPEGRLFQIEYAQKAVKNSGTAIGLVCKDGVVFAVENLKTNTLLEKGSNSRISTPNRHIGFCNAGWQPDSYALFRYAKEEAQTWKKSYGSKIPTKNLAEKIASQVQLYTCYWHLRPYGCSVLLGGFTEKEPELFMIDPTGECVGYYAIAVGKGQSNAKGELESIKPGSLTCREAIKELSRIIYKIHDFQKEKDFTLELSWICEESKKFHVEVPENLVEECKEYAQNMKKKDEELDELKEEKKLERKEKLEKKEKQSKGETEDVEMKDKKK